ncbi:unnamed protein product [Rotaria sordida]|uniref:Major facilitator superfamily (MFS) profile domain-containing protein n=1 Tax=Rotaria sordida TaxID=392033 RepID=A0A815G7X7_9BILA|nr:unnamed protein product [Rotaria sordida]
MPRFLLEFGGTASVSRGSLTSAVSGSIVGLLVVGCFFGALIAGQAGDRLSRKYSIVLFSVIFSVGGAIQASSISLVMLLASRFISGLGVGALSMLVPVYQSEIAPKEIRGRLVSLQQWAITIGIAVSFWINYATDIQLSGSSASWRIPLALQIVPAFILVVGKNPKYHRDNHHSDCR